MAQTRRDIQALLSAGGIRPLKRFGQNFLVDGNLMDKLILAAGIERRDVVLEVGPGTGALTERLLELAGHVLAVEIDRGLQELCRSRLGASANFTLIAGDILEGKGTVAPAVLAKLSAQRRTLDGRILLVANLPYQVATPLVIDLLLGELRISPMCFTVQAEVGERLAALPGGKEYGPISVFAQVLADVRRIARVPPEAFWPAPKVRSVMLRLDVVGERRPSAPVLAELIRLVHGCFNHRRKTMLWNLRELLAPGIVEQVAKDGRWDLALRPERITPKQWVDLAALVADGRHASPTAAHPE